MQHDEAVQSCPAQQPRMCVVLWSTAWFPDAFIGFVPVFQNVVSESDKCFLHLAIKRPPARCILRSRVNDFAINVELELMARRVANTNWAGLPVAVQPR